MSKFKFFIVSCSIFLVACIPAKNVAKFDQKTGVIQVEQGKKLGKAEVIKNTKINISKYKEMVFFSSNQYYIEYGHKQLKEIGYFEEVMKFDDLEKLVIKNKLQDKVIDLNSQIGLSRLAKNYKPFLWVKLTPYTENNESYMKLTASNAEDAEDIFEARTSWSGSSDESVLYPLYNELSLWIRNNS